MNESEPAKSEPVESKPDKSVRRKWAIRIVIGLAIVGVMLIAAVGGLYWAVREMALAPNAIVQVDPALSVAENAETIANLFAERYPNRALVIGIIDGDHREVITRGTLPNGEPVDENSLFEIGSVTKTFTGLLLADAVVRGEMTLDDSIGTLLPDAKLAEGVESITLRQLSRHTSGLPRLPDDIFSGADSTNPYAHYDRDHLDHSLEHAKLSKGGKPVYSNMGVGLLGDLIARSHDRTYADLLTTRVLEPLEMPRTFIEIPHDRADDFVQGHLQQSPTPAWDMAALVGAGGLRSSGADMLTYAAAMLDPPEELRPAIEMVLTEEHPDTSWAAGLCWQQAGPAKDQVTWHNGATYGCGTYVALRPKAGRVIVVLYNEVNMLALMFGKPLPDVIGRALIALDAPE